MNKVFIPLSRKRESVLVAIRAGRDNVEITNFLNLCRSSLRRISKELEKCEGDYNSLSCYNLKKTLTFLLELFLFFWTQPPSSPDLNSIDFFL
uniref:Uncharacterized protein n=1 Tax=Lepeophtheirus salmonis TaxID=72036 RepID=A0A0K2TSZ4_LEPSM